MSSRQIAIPSIKITFPDGTEDFAVLQHYNPIAQGRDEQEEDIDQCIFDGYLLNEKDVSVTVTGCPNADNFGVIPLQAKRVGSREVANLTERKIHIPPFLVSKNLSVCLSLCLSVTEFYPNFLRPGKTE